VNTKLIFQVGANTGAISQAAMYVSAPTELPDTILTKSDLSEESKNQDKVEKEVMKVWQSIWLLKSLLLDLLYPSRTSSGIVVVEKTLVNVCRKEECRKPVSESSNGRDGSGGKMSSVHTSSQGFQIRLYARVEGFCSYCCY